MRTVLVIGMGTGDPSHLTLQAVEAIRRAEVVVLLDKGEATDDMRELRRRMLTAHRDDDGPREIVVDDPRRDSEVAAVDYPRAVDEWHVERARRVAAALESGTDDDGVAAFLVWGDPSLYDSTLRILDRVRDAGAEFRPEVIPGICAPTALAAAFGICLNRVGEPVHVTTGRLLPGTASDLRRNVVVMLDGSCSFREVAGPDTYIWWGAYLGSDDQILVQGRVADVTDEIVSRRAAARDEHGWIMDTYLLRDA